MATFKVRVEGLRELDAALGQLPKAVAKGVLRRVGIKALKPFDEAWRRKAPRDSGDLAESGGVGTKLTRRQARLARASARAGGKDFVEIYAGPNNAAAVPQEFGTITQSAQPFVRPAWDATHMQVLDGIKRDLGAEIDKTAKRAARRAAKRAAGG